MREIIRTILGIVLCGLLLAGCASRPSQFEHDAHSVATAVPQPPPPPLSPPESGPQDVKIRDARSIEQPQAPRYEDLWDRIRSGFALPHLDSKYVADYERWYRNRPEYLKRLVNRAQRYLFYIVEEVEKRKMPTEIALLPAIESAFKPTAYSRAHAVGLWQFIPATGRRYGLKQNWWYDGRRDVVEATQAALNYLQQLHDEFDGDWFLALAAYNAGEKRVHKAIAYNRKRKRDTVYSKLRLKAETRRYVPKLIALKNVVFDPHKFGLRLDSIPNEPYFAEVDLESQIDLSVISKSAEIPHTELRSLNPAFRRWATDPNGPHRLLVPVASRQQVQRTISKLPDSARMRWIRHRIRRGDTLSTIARRHGVTVRVIQSANNLRGTRIRAGRDLLIPVSLRRYAAAASAHPASRSSKRAKTRKLKPVVYRVRSGDTLWGIARRHDVYVRQLTRWNAIHVNDVLRLGQKILIYRN